MADDRLTTRDVAEMFGVNICTVVRWVDSGRLPAVRDSRGWRRIDRAVVAEFTRPALLDAQRLCGLEVCVRPHHAEGLCRPHYQRWRRTGDVRADCPILPRWPAGLAPGVRRFDVIDDDEL